MERRDEAYFAGYRERSDMEGRLELPADLTVRPALPADCAGMAALRIEREGGVLEEVQARFQQRLTAATYGEQSLAMVADYGGRIVGYGLINWFQPQPDAPANTAPTGWYLGGLIVGLNYRRRGIGAELTRLRLEWIAARADEAYYFANARNLVSIALHTRFGFVELTRDFTCPGATFTGGVGILFRAVVNNTVLQNP